MRKYRNTVRCSVSETQSGQPGVLRGRTAIEIRWLPLSIYRTGLSDSSPEDAPTAKRQLDTNPNKPEGILIELAE